MTEITLDELCKKAELLNEKAGTVMIEDKALREQISKTADIIAETAEQSRKIAILTDYDADGICSAYIMHSMLYYLNPELDISVVCNDRREAYGVPKFVEPDADTRYIVMDMGSNELDYIRNTFGRQTIVIDHHLIEDEDVKFDFEICPNLLNPHYLHDDDSLNADYCATGLAYRIYTELSERYPQLRDDILQNTCSAVACIGTCADVVNLADEHSQNRHIVRQGLQAIGNATQWNMDSTLLYLLDKCGVARHDVTAKDIAFKVAPVLNSASRMSDILQINGAMMMYKSLMTSDTERLDFMLSLNQKRKEYSRSLQDEQYQDFVQYERFSDDNIAVYVADNISSGFCGLVAGKLSEALDKAVICLTYHEDKGIYTGSGRNADGMSSLKELIDEAVVSPEAEGIEITYGGHTDAVGISSLNSVKLLENALKACAKDIVREQDMTVLNITPEELHSEETLQKLQSLEPVGNGFQIPPVIVEGKKVNPRSLKKHDDWKSFSVNGMKVTDWSYSDKKYLCDADGCTKFPAELNISDYNGKHIELNAVWSRQVYDDFQQEIIEQNEIRKARQKKSRNDYTRD